jgi:hypothetical protein
MEEEIKEVKEEVEEEIEEEEEDDCNDFLRMPVMDLNVELPTAADLLGLNDEE